VEVFRNRQRRHSALGMLRSHLNWFGGAP
jgi:hypothetical protein